MQQAGEHLERGGLAGAVWAEEADDLAGAMVKLTCCTAWTSLYLRRKKLRTAAPKPPSRSGTW